jgi:hypothetical protein
MPKLKVLTEEQIEMAIESVLRGDTLARTGELLGFKTRMEFHDYLRRHPFLDEKVRAARIDGCIHLEDRMLNVTKEVEDPRLARVQVEAYAKVMGYRNPQRYGNRIDVNLTQTVDIGSSLAKMQERLDATYRDVTPAIEGAKAKDIKDLL